LVSKVIGAKNLGSKSYSFAYFSCLRMEFWSATSLHDR